MAPSAVPACGWREPPRAYPEGAQWTCAAVEWRDGDTLTAKCDGEAGTVAVRLRGVDTEKHGEGRWRQAREELRRRTEGRRWTCCRATAAAGTWSRTCWRAG